MKKPVHVFFLITGVVFNSLLYACPTYEDELRVNVDNETGGNLPLSLVNWNNLDQSTSGTTLFTPGQQIEVGSGTATAIDVCFEAPLAPPEPSLDNLPMPAWRYIFTLAGNTFFVGPIGTLVSGGDQFAPSSTYPPYIAPGTGPGNTLLSADMDLVEIVQDVYQQTCTPQPMGGEDCTSNNYYPAVIPYYAAIVYGNTTNSIATQCFSTAGVNVTLVPQNGWLPTSAEVVLDIIIPLNSGSSTTPLAVRQTPPAIPAERGQNPHTLCPNP